MLRHTRWEQFERVRAATLWCGWRKTRRTVHDCLPFAEACGAKGVMRVARCSRDVRILGTETIGDGFPSRRVEHALRQRHRTAGTAGPFGVLGGPVSASKGSRDPAVGAWHLARAARCRHERPRLESRFRRRSGRRPAQTLYLFDRELHARHFQILGAKTLEHPSIENVFAGPVDAQAAEEFDAPRNSHSAVSQSSTSCPSWQPRAQYSSNARRAISLSVFPRTAEW